MRKDEKVMILRNMGEKNPLLGARGMHLGSRPRTGPGTV